MKEETVTVVMQTQAVAIVRAFTKVANLKDKKHSSQ
jgi:hypothetical protein